ncbi:glutamate 5-kinase [Gillisia sp. Hel_I_86]|uniref:amino acid kinase family protein n=1 Tax=Gillisia sp. Hel_I_86 TaxID=1249981 RepID=UPI0011995554|nr:hypothetical protein [Gillisia sp. Hel_I_86]TVZ26819.1 glutamate 5-kinase [Gillisia sp. Hel_I_86]
MTQAYENELIVLKFGTTSVCDKKTMEIKEKWIQSVGEEVKRLKEKGNKVIIFTSGGLATGRQEIVKIKLNNQKIQQNKKALGAIGLSKLLYKWQKNFGHIGLLAAALTIREEDIETTSICELILELTENGIVPIINENIPLQSDYNNDELASKICKKIGASKFILFTDTDGIFTDNPKTNPTAKQLQVINIDDIDVSLTENESGLGSGGMREKLNSAIRVKTEGVDTIIANGVNLYPISNLGIRNKCTVLTKKTDENGYK